MVMKMLIDFFRPTYHNVLNVLIEMQIRSQCENIWVRESINQQAIISLQYLKRHPEMSVLC